MMQVQPNIPNSNIEQLTWIPDITLMIPQPKKLSVKLYNHQLVNVYKMEMIEKNKTVMIGSCYYIDTNIGINAQLAGYGKTLEMVTLVLRNKMEWDPTTLYENIEYIQLGPGITTRHISYLSKLDCTLVLVSPSIITQWKAEFSKTNLSVLVYTAKMGKIDPNDYHVILCGPNQYKSLVMMYPSSEYIWKRFIYDEPGITMVPGMKPISYGFMWLVTATPDVLHNYSNKHTNFMKFVGRTVCEYTRYLTCKCDDEFVKSSYSLPKPVEFVYYTLNKIHKMVRGLVAENILEMISAGDIQSAIAHLGGNETDNIVDLLKKKKNDEMIYIDSKIECYTKIGKKEKVKKWIASKKRVQDQIDELESRYSDALKDECCICREDMKNPVLVSCCQNIICGSCILEWMKTHSNCPMCRSDLVAKMLIYVNKDNQKVKKEMKEEKKEDDNVYASKTDIVLDIIKRYTMYNGDIGKFIIFSSHDTRTIENLLRANLISYHEVKGSSTSRDRILLDFKNGKFPVLILDAAYNGAGINIQEATDVILYHELSPSLETQVVARAQRIGRKQELRVHRLLNKDV